jgi:hypothetical protein
MGADRATGLPEIIALACGMSRGVTGPRSSLEFVHVLIFSPLLTQLSSVSGFRVLKIRNIYYG